MYIHVKVLANAKKESFEEVSENRFSVSVKEKAERNQANERILKLMRDHFNVGKVRIINGHHSPSKLISVDVD